MHIQKIHDSFAKASKQDDTIKINGARTEGQRILQKRNSEEFKRGAGFCYVASNVNVNMKNKVYDPAQKSQAVKNSFKIRAFNVHT